MTLTCTRVRQSHFIDRDIVFEIDFDDKMKMGRERVSERSVKLRKEFADLGMAFHRNRVELRFEVDYDDRDCAEWPELKEKVTEFCDSRLTGYWTWKLRRRTLNGGNSYQFEMDLMFEHEADMQLWLKDHGMIIRLTL